MRVRPQRALGPLSLLTAIGALIWFSAAFNGVSLHYGGSSGCPQLRASTTTDLWNASVGPLVTLSIAMLGSAYAAASAHRKITKGEGSTSVFVGLLISALIGIGACVEFMPARRDDSIVFLFWLVLGGFLALITAVAALIERFARPPQPTTRWTVATIGLTTSYFLVLPYTILALSPTDSAGLCS